jgi:hypothetical protein
MGQRKVTILDTAADAVAEVAFFVEAKGMPQTAKKFVAEAFEFLRNFLMKGLNTAHAVIRYGKV